MKQQLTTSRHKLRVYQLSRQLEDDIHELIKQLPASEFYGLGDELRRGSATVAHYISEADQRYSYSLKVETLNLARTAIRQVRELLSQYQKESFGSTAEIRKQYQALSQQLWALIAHYRRRQQERQSRARIKAADALAFARS
ncbi:four helix bundle protein [Patescibacteria group bacterium]|nr:MAG: four helix bundle protein [Patescibacteria group bacterium]